MTQDTDELNWTLPTPGDKSEAGEWAQILVDAINKEIEPDVVKALEKQTNVKHAKEADHASTADSAKQAKTADKAGKVIFGDGTARELQVNGSDKQGVVNFKTK